MEDKEFIEKWNKAMRYIINLEEKASDMAIETIKKAGKMEKGFEIKEGFQKMPIEGEVFKEKTIHTKSTQGVGLAFVCMFCEGLQSIDNHTDPKSIINICDRCKSDLKEIILERRNGK